MSDAAVFSFSSVSKNVLGAISRLRGVERIHGEAAVVRGMMQPVRSVDIEGPKLSGAFLEICAFRLWANGSVILGEQKFHVVPRGFTAEAWDELLSAAVFSYTDVQWRGYIASGKIMEKEAEE